MNFREGSFKIPHEIYHQDPVIEPSLSRGIIMDLLFRSTAHAWINHPRLNPDCKPEVDKKFDKGQVAHGLFLEGINRAIALPFDDWRKKEAKEQRDQARAEGKVPLLEHQFVEVTDMVKAANQALNESELSGLFDDGDAELSYVWEEGGTWCRIMVDKISKDREFCLDYKTTGQSANPEDFIRTILSHGYDVQESFYRRGVKAIEKTDPKFIFLIQEDEPPYLCSFVGLTPEFQKMANEKVIRGIDLWRSCMASGKWPGYPNRVCWIEPPPWALTWEMRANFIGNKMEDL